MEPLGRRPEGRPEGFMVDVKEDMKLIGFREEDAEDPCSLSSPLFCQAKPPGETRRCSVEFVVRNSLLQTIVPPTGKKKASPFSPAPLISLLVAQSLSLSSILKRCETTEICMSNASMVYPFLSQLFSKTVNNCSYLNGR